MLAQSLEAAKDKGWDDLAEPGARLIVQGSYAGEFSLPYNAAFLRELSIHVPRDVQPRDVRAALDLMTRGKLSLEGLVSEVRAPEAAPETYAALADPNAALITVAFNWQR